MPYRVQKESYADTTKLELSKEPGVASQLLACRVSVGSMEDFRYGKLFLKQSVVWSVR